MKTRFAKPLPNTANDRCTKCDKLFLPKTPVYHIDNDKLGRENCKCITCFRGLNGK